MPKIFKKFILSFLSFLILFFSVAPNFIATKAAPTPVWYSQSPFEWYQKVYDQTTSPSNEIFGERYTAAQVQWVVYGFLFMPIRMIESVVGENSITCFIKGFDGTLDLKVCGKAILDFADKLTGAIPELTSNPNDNNKSIVTLIFDTNGRDISGIAYTKDLLNKFSLVSPVHAQGFGYTGLTWIQKYWKGFRDISYSLLVLVVIVFAFMIMFRMKLNPQTVISVQSALPKVVVALILITFSYAIAGFAIDLMYVVSGLFAFLLKSAGFSQNINGAFGTIAGTGAGYGIFGGFWIFFGMLAYAIMFVIAAILSFFATFAAGINVFGMVLSIVFVLIAVWVVVLSILYTIKVPYVLIKTLISIYISIITAPIQILAGTIFPSAGFGSWIKKLMSDILVFPVVGLLFWFAWSLLWSAYAQTGLDVVRFYSSVASTSNSTWIPVSTDNSAWIPGIIGSRGLGHTSGISGILFLAMSFGMIVLIPKVPDLLKSLILGEKFSFGSAIGEAVGPLRQAWGQFGAPSLRAMQEYSGLVNANKIFSKLDKITTDLGLTNLSKRFKTLKSTTGAKITQP